MQETKSNIYKVLSKRDELQSWSQWEDFFRNILSSNEVAHVSYINALSILGHEVGGTVQQKEANFTTFKW